MLNLRWQVATLAAIGLVGVGGALFLSWYPTKLSHQQEWVKALLQAGLIAVLGVVTSAVLESYKDGIQSRRDESKLRLQALAELGRIYMDVKLIRRVAQSSGLLSDAQLAELNERQVLLELQLENRSQFESQTSLGSALATLERYLNRVANKPESEERREFLSAEGFRTFSNAYRQASNAMRNDITPRKHNPLANEHRA